VQLGRTSPEGNGSDFTDWTVPAHKQSMGSLKGRSRLARIDPHPQDRRVAKRKNP
jgi:hypothetical protein